MQMMTETYERALKDTADAKAGIEPPIEIRLNRQLKEKVASLAGLRGMDREDSFKLAHAIHSLLEKA